jgi:hypothetical protein
MELDLLGLAPQTAEGYQLDEFRRYSLPSQSASHNPADVFITVPFFS